MTQLFDDIRAEVQFKASQIDILPMIIKKLCDDVAHSINHGADIAVEYKDILHEYKQAKLKLHRYRKDERDDMYSTLYDRNIQTKIAEQKQIVYKLRDLKNKSKYNL